MTDEYLVVKKDVLACLCNGKCNEEGRWCDDGYCAPVKRILALPVVDKYRKRKEAKWITRAATEDDVPGWPEFIVCSKCGGLATAFYSVEYGDEQMTQIKTAFCPSCGADMRKDMYGSNKSKKEE